MKRLLSILCIGLIAAPAQAAFDIKSKQMILVDDTANTVLLAKEADSKMYPSSMSKLMTLYVLFEKLKEGSITLDTTFPVSEKAWRKGGSKMFVKVNTEVRVEDLIRGIIVQSGNDACIVVAEALAGSEEAFAKQMNRTAKEIGLTASQFVNSTGWPDENHIMTARDLAVLSKRLVVDFPDYYPYFAEAEYSYSNITQPNRNRLLDKGIGVDGLKTGHTEAAGYGIAVSAKQPDGERRVTTVVNGLKSDGERIAEARRMVEYGFREFEVKTIKQTGETITTLPVWLGSEDQVALGVSKALQIALPRDEQAVSFHVEATSPISAPISAGQPLGTLEIRNGELVMKSVPLVAVKAVEEASFLSQLWNKTLNLLEL